ncbi:MAG: hypothetical protein KDC57_06075, partial [Saprospiraceae bacterium]|nr:hypothetical protein [Saprospiraceae bacterium]
MHIGEALFLYAEGEGYFRKICCYFLCSFIDLANVKSEIDHEVLWCNEDEVFAKINFTGAHKWALE